MKRRPLLFALSGAGVVIALGTIAVLVGHQDRPKPDPYLNAAALMATALPDTEGKRQSFAQWQGKVLVLNFWATWCGPCKEELPMLARLAPELAKDGVQVVGIAVDSRQNVANFVQKVPISYPSLIGEDGAIEFSRRLGNRLGVLPYTVFVDRKGEVVYKKVGKVDAEEVVKMSSIAAKNQ